MTMNVHATTGLTELISDMASDQLAEFAINALGLQPAVARATTRTTWTELVQELARQGSGSNGSAKVLEWIMAPNIYVT